MDEAAVILAYQRGDAHAFDILFELHAAHVYRTSYLIVRDTARAEDVAQETFLILAQRLPGLAPAPLRSWLGRGAPWPLRALTVPLALTALGGAWFGADALATAVVSVSRHTDSLVVDYGLMRRLAGVVFRDPAPAANVLGVLAILAPGAVVLLAAVLALWLASAALMRRVSMRVRGAIIILAALVAAIAGGSAVLAQPTTDAMRVVTTGRSPLVLALDARGRAETCNG